MAGTTDRNVTLGYRYGGDLAQGTWLPPLTAVGATVVQVAEAPIGAIMTGIRVIENTANAAHAGRETNTWTIASGQQRDIAVMVKAFGRTKGWIFISTSDAGANRAGVDYDLTARTVVNHVQGAGAIIGVPTITPVGNGWFYITFSAKQNGGDLTSLLVMRLADNAGTLTYLGDGMSGAAYY